MSGFWRVADIAKVPGHILDYVVTVERRSGETVVYRGSCTVWSRADTGERCSNYDRIDMLYAAWKRAEWARG